MDRPVTTRMRAERTTKPAAGQRRELTRPAPAGPSTGQSAAVVLAMCILVIVVTVASGASPIAAGLLPDTDDYMRLTQVFAWLDGAGWRSLVEMRLNPPDGTPMHWSRLPDLPLAAVVGSVEPWLGRIHAAMLAAWIVPPLLLAGFLAATAWMARPLVGRGAALLCVFLVAMPMPIIFQFAPGRVDHDNWQFIFAALTLGSLARLALRPDSRRTAMVAAVAFALALWVGGECLPWLMAFNLALTLLWIIGGRAYSGAAMICAATMLAIDMPLLPLVQAPAFRSVPLCDGFGIVYASLPAFMLTFWCVLWLSDRRVRSRPARFATAALCAAAVTAAFLVLFPACRGGPLGQVDPRLTEVWASHVGEGLPVTSLFAGSLWRVPLVMLAPLAALVVAVVQSFRCRGRPRRVWLSFAVHLMTALALCFVQIRVLGFAYLYAAAPLVWLVGKAALGLTGWRAGAVKPVALGVLAPVFLLALPAMVYATSVAGQADGKRADCDIALAATALADPAGLGARSRLVAAPVDFGPELLFRTPHQVLAAPYQHDVTGNLDVFDLFSARDASTARAIVARRHVDLILLCPAKPGMWLPAFRPNFFDQLSGDQAPGWLRALPMPEKSGVRLYEVIGHDDGPRR